MTQERYARGAMLKKDQEETILVSELGSGHENVYVMYVYQGVPIKLYMVWKYVIKTRRNRVGTGVDMNVYVM